MKTSQRSMLKQAVAGLAVGGIVIGAVVYWSVKDDDPKPCKAASNSAANVTASTMCTVMQKAGLPTLLGVPKEKAAFGGGMANPAQNGGDPSISVLYTVGPYSVVVSTHKPGQVKGTEQVAGHAAALATGTSSGGRPLYNLVVSYDAAGTGFYSVNVTMTDGSVMAQDNAEQLEKAVAEKVLPGLPEWKS